jgi:hypothetical protein
VLIRDTGGSNGAAQSSLLLHGRSFTVVRRTFKADRKRSALFTQIHLLTPPLVSFIEAWRLSCRLRLDTLPPGKLGGFYFTALPAT